MVPSAFPRLCISSTRGGGGKTLASLGIGRALARRGLLVKPFKKGPDFIDAAWLGHACLNPATNLDPFFLDAPRLRGLFCQAARRLCPENPANVISLIEGNRGLYDGLDSSGAVSTATLARALAAPVILCIDCSKSTRTIAALLRGMISFEEGLVFAGVVLNQAASSRHEANLRRAVEELTPLRVLGVLPRLENNPLPERHMGLASKGAGLAEGIEAALDNLADFARAHIDLDSIIEIARNAGPLPGGVEYLATQALAPTAKNRGKGDAPRIGYVEDDALWFYYPENLEALEHAGASLVKLSLLDKGRENAKKWENLDGLYLGGGFPEDFAREISASPFLPRLRSRAEAGLPVYAECGGLIVLCHSLEREGVAWPMAGVFPARAKWHAKPAGLGYIEAKVARENPYFPLGLELRGHEFHYSSCDFPEGVPPLALEISRGSGLARLEGKAWDAMLYKNTWASYTHIFAQAAPGWAERFTAAARVCRASRNSSSP